MTTLRIASRRRYTNVDRRSINSCGLSLRALGLLVWLLDKPDDWKVDSSSITRHVQEGREAVRTAMRELEEHGFLVRRKYRISGRWATEVLVYEHPELAELSAATEAQKPATAAVTEAQETEDGLLGVGFLGAVVPEDGDKKTDTEEIPSPTTSTKSPAHLLVEAFWDYRKREGLPSPTLPTNGSGSPFMALVKIVQKLLDAGHSEARVKCALRDTDAYSIHALTFQLNHNTPPESGPRAAIEEMWDRDAPTRVVQG